MAHMIEDNQFAYVGEVPWHGLGTQVEKGTTGAQMLKIAGLNWPVELTDIAVKSGKKFEEQPVEEYKAITRGDTGKVFMIATTKYQPMQNIEVVDFFKEYCEAGNATMETVGALRGGATIWALAKLKGGDASIGGIDPVKAYMLFYTSHDGTLATAGRPTQTRVVCNNTLTAALKGKAGENSFRMLHNTKWTPERREEAQRVMGLAIEQVEATNVIAEQLSKVKIDESDWLKFMAGLLGGADLVIEPKKAVLTRTAQMIQTATLTSPGSDLKTAKGTLWGAVNGVSYYADHDRGFSTTTQESRLTAAWFGGGNSLKTKALEVAMAMAEISR